MTAAENEVSAHTVPVTGHVCPSCPRHGPLLLGPAVALSLSGADAAFGSRLIGTHCGEGPRQRLVQGHSDSLEHSLQTSWDADARANGADAPGLPAHPLPLGAS